MSLFPSFITTIFPRTLIVSHLCFSWIFYLIPPLPLNLQSLPHSSLLRKEATFNDVFFKLKFSQLCLVLLWFHWIFFGYLAFELAVHVLARFCSLRSCLVPCCMGFSLFCWNCPPQTDHCLFTEATGLTHWDAVDQISFFQKCYFYISAELDLHFHLVSCLWFPSHLCVVTVQLAASKQTYNFP